MTRLAPHETGYGRDGHEYPPWYDDDGPEGRPDRTPRERWGTCCPYDPECEHSYLDVDELSRWMDTPITDVEARRMVEP